MTDDEVKLIGRLHELANCLEADPAFNPLTNMEYVSALRDAAVAIVQANSSSPDGRMREATIEECAKVAEAQYLKSEADFVLCGDTLDFIAARIRSLSPNSEPVHNPDSPKPLSDEDAFDIQPKDRADG